MLSEATDILSLVVEQLKKHSDDEGVVTAGCGLLDALTEAGMSNRLVRRERERERERTKWSCFVYKLQYSVMEDFHFTFSTSITSHRG